MATMTEYDGTLSLEHVVAATSPSWDHEVARGRRRDRSMTRASVGSIRTEESSTLRGRSRRRATSPSGCRSPASTPSLMSPTRQLLLQNRLGRTRREHCPSRAGSPTRRDAPGGRRQRSRSRTRKTELQTQPARSIEPLSSSSLRNEVLIEGDGALGKTGS